MAEDLIAAVLEAQCVALIGVELKIDGQEFRYTPSKYSVSINGQEYESATWIQKSLDRHFQSDAIEGDPHGLRVLVISAALSSPYSENGKRYPYRIWLGHQNITGANLLSEGYAIIMSDLENSDIEPMFDAWVLQ